MLQLEVSARQALLNLRRCVCYVFVFVWFMHKLFPKTQNVDIFYKRRWDFCPAPSHKGFSFTDRFGDTEHFAYNSWGFAGLGSVFSVECIQRRRQNVRIHNNNVISFSLSLLLSELYGLGDMPTNMRLIFTTKKDAIPGHARTYNMPQTGFSI